MKKLGRLLLWLLGGLVLLACIVLLGVNLYVQSRGTHQRIQQELSQRLGTPLHLRQISVTPWSGLKLNGITIPQEPGKIGGNFLQAQSFQLRVQFWSLFSDRLVIRQVSLIKPEVVWAQNSSGKWRLPELPAEPIPPLSAATPAASGTTTSSPAATSSAPASVATLPNEPAPAPTPPQVFTPEVQRVNLKDGDFTFLDSAGRVIAKFMGLDFRSSFRAATEIKGNASVEKISLRDRFFIQDLESPLRYDPSGLAFSNISAHAAGGAMSGRFEMELQTVDSPFTAEVKFRDLQAEKLVTNAGGPAGMIQGRVEGFLDAKGKTADSNALSGRGEIIMRDGKLQQYSLLVALGQILQIDELMQLQLEQAEVKYHISPGIVTIDQLLLRSPNIRLTATGTISFEGKLRLNSQLALNDKVRRQLFAPIRENFQSIAEPAGYAAVDFKVSGTIDRPKTNLMDKLVGRDLRDLGGVISSLFGHGKKKKPKEAATPSPAPDASPNDTVAAPPPAELESPTPRDEATPETSSTPEPAASP
ncbi:MAG: AsmA family protein [Verrucomicrobiota bacterium]|nr:AsmA family protein [Verrucomicrobiota bacterium]